MLPPLQLWDEEKSQSRSLLQCWDGKKSLSRSLLLLLSLFVFCVVGVVVGVVGIGCVVGVVGAAFAVMLKV